MLLLVLELVLRLVLRWLLVLVVLVQVLERNDKKTFLFRKTWLAYRYRERELEIGTHNYM